MTSKKKGYWIVYLEWEDAMSSSLWVGDLQRSIDWAADGFVIKQTGFLIHEDKQHLLFAGNWRPDVSDKEEMFGSLHKIPTTWIRNRKKLMFVEAK